MNQTQGKAVRKSFQAALICFAWTIVIWLILNARTMAGKYGLGTGAAASLLSFALPVLAGTLAYQFVMGPWLASNGSSQRSRFFWMILVPCALAAAVLLIAR